MKTYLTKALIVLATLIFVTPSFAAGTTSKSASKTPEVKVSDSQIVSDVKAKVAADPSVSGAVVTITSNKGTVLIVGTVNNADQAGKLVLLAQSSDGVKDVDTVKLTDSDSSALNTDALITAKIQGKYLQKKILTDQDITAGKITIETRNGIVTLTGTVDNAQQLKMAAILAKKTSGVKDILNNLKIAQH